MKYQYNFLVRLSKVTIVSSPTTDLTFYFVFTACRTDLRIYQNFQKQRNNSSSFKLCIEPKFIDWYSFSIILPSISNSKYRPPINRMWRKHQPHSKLKWKVVRTNFLISNLLKRNQHLLLPELNFFFYKYFNWRKGQPIYKARAIQIIN